MQGDSSMDIKCNAERPDTLYHILVLGQSLSMGFATLQTLPPIAAKNAYMFHRVRSQDFGYIFGITKEEYAVDPGRWEGEFYHTLQPLCESGGDGDAGKCWESASPAEFETPCSGIITSTPTGESSTPNARPSLCVIIRLAGAGISPFTATS